MFYAAETDEHLKRIDNFEKIMGRWRRLLRIPRGWKKKTNECIDTNKRIHRYTKAIYLNDCHIERNVMKFVRHETGKHTMVMEKFRALAGTNNLFEISPGKYGGEKFVAPMILHIFGVSVYRVIFPVPFYYPVKGKNISLSSNLCRRVFKVHEYKSKMSFCFFLKKF